MKQTLPAFMKYFLNRIQDDDVFGLAAQLAFFFLLSLFPLLIILMTLFSFLQLSQEDMLSFFRTFTPAESMQLIEANLQDIMENRSGKLLSIGIVATLWSASNGMNAIVKALNKAHDVTETRSFLVARGMAIVLTFLMVFVFIIALFLQLFGNEIGSFIISFFHVSDKFIEVWTLMRMLASSIIPLLIFTVLYWVAPNKKITFTSAIPGAIFATIGWAITSLVFSYYVGNFANYSATYGSIGAIIILMIWFYLSGIIIIIGGELNAYLHISHKSDL